MKKFKSLVLLLLCILTATMQAQTLVTDAATELTDGTFISLQCRDTNGGAGYYFNGAALKSSIFFRFNIFKVVGGPDGFKLCRVTDNKYVGRSDKSLAMVDDADDASVFTATSYKENEPHGFSSLTVDDGSQMNGTNNALYVRFAINIDNEAFYLNTQAKGASPQYTTGTGGYSVWYVYKYTQEEVNQAPGVVSESSGISNAKAYFLKSARGADKYLVYADSKGLYLSSNYGSGVTNWVLDGADCWKFAIYKSGEKYYFYNIQADAFIGYGFSNNDEIPLVKYPTNYIEIREASTVANHPFMFSCREHGAINLAGVRVGSKGVVNWVEGRNDYGDSGNAFQILEAGDLSEELQNTIKSRVEAAEAKTNGTNLSTTARYNVKVSSSNGYVYMTNMPWGDNINCLMGYKEVTTSNSGKAVLKLENVDGLNYVYRIKYQQNQLSEEYKNLVWLNTNDNEKAGVQVLTDDNTGLSGQDKWYVYPSGDNFKIRPYLPAGHWNIHGGGTTNPVGIWGSESQASTVVFEETDLAADAVAAAFPDYRNAYLAGKSECPWTTKDNMIGYAPEAAYQEAFNNAGSASSLYECMKMLQEKNHILLPDPNKYYMIRNAKVEGEYLYEKYDELQDGKYSLFCSTLAANTVPSLWKFERMTDAGKTHMLRVKGLNSGLYISKATWGYVMRMLPENSQDVGEFDLVPKAYVDVEGAVDLHDTTHDGTPRITGEGTLDSYNDKNQKNNFFIEEITSIPVTIGEVGYATLNLPFAVTKNPNVKAYTAAEDGDKLQLSEITAEVLPANTPVILVANKGIYDFTIAYGNTDESLTTALSGTLVPATIAEGASAYILKNGTSGIGMYLVNSETDRTIPANKAYYGSTSASGEVKRFAFDDGTTGIDVIGDAINAKAEVYSIDGRRVLRPSKGVYVVGGKKIIIK